MVENAGIVQLVEHLLAKEKVTGSSPVARSRTYNKWLMAMAEAAASHLLSANFFGDVAKW